MEEIQKKFQSDLDNFKATQKEYHKALSQRQQLDAQLHENTTVKKELDLLKEDGEVFKLMGPVLIKQDVLEAQQTVSKRVDYITSELKRLDGMISTLETKQETQKGNLIKAQQQLQQAQMKAAIKS